MATGSNRRTDDYGGSVITRARLTLEVVDTVVAVMGADRVGIRISPLIEIFGLTDDEPEAMAFYLAEQFDARGLAYLHINEPDWAGGDINLSDAFRCAMRERFATGVLIFCGHYTAERAAQLIEKGLGDGAAFGRPTSPTPIWLNVFAMATSSTRLTRVHFTAVTQPVTPTIRPAWPRLDKPPKRPGTDEHMHRREACWSI